MKTGELSKGKGKCGLVKVCRSASRGTGFQFWLHLILAVKMTYPFEAQFLYLQNKDNKIIIPTSTELLQRLINIIHGENALQTAECYSKTLLYCPKNSEMSFWNLSRYFIILDLLRVSLRCVNVWNYMSNCLSMCVYAFWGGKRSIAFNRFSKKFVTNRD